MWKVYGYCEPFGYYKRGGEMHGPLPRKRWIPDAADRKHKMNYKAPKRISGGAEDAATYNARRAVEYARWLAARDGIDVTDLDGVAVLGFFEGQNGKTCRRFQSVDFFKPQNTHFGRRVTRPAASITIAIPHWDFDPVEPLEEFVEISATPARRTHVSAYVVVDKLGNRVASVAIKFNSVLYAYVHVFGGPMTRGSAGGGGYDKTSAAVLEAVAKIDRDAYDGVFRDHADAFKRMVDCGYGWERQLTDAGYRVYQAV